ncbi:hypothetical protein AOLI_G00232200 [Acnodon oligacanthus]
MAACGSEEKTYRRFLELFLREMRPPLPEDGPLPTRPLSDSVAEDEVPPGVNPHLLRHRCDEVLVPDQREGMKASEDSDISEQEVIVPAVALG